MGGGGYSRRWWREIAVRHWAKEGGKCSERGRFRPNKETETVSQLPPNPVQGGLSQFLSWIENNSHRLRLQ